MKKYISKSEQETYDIAREFASTLKGGEFVELIGDLGSGKTTFVRGVVKALGSKVRVKSPTFTITNEYPIDNEKIKKVVHADFYRFENPVQLESLSMDDYNNDETVILVEWPDVFGGGVFAPTHTIKFEFIDENTRKIVL